MRLVSDSTILINIVFVFVLAGIIIFGVIKFT
jgi:hypothetical protein